MALGISWLNKVNKFRVRTPFFSSSRKMCTNISIFFFLFILVSVISRRNVVNSFYLRWWS